MTYAELGERLGVAASTAHRWINPSPAPRRRAAAAPAPVVRVHAAATRDVMALIDSGHPPDPQPLTRIAPDLDPHYLAALLRHLRTFGWLDSHAVRSSDVPNPDAVEALVRGTCPPMLLDHDERRDAEIAAGCLIALREVREGAPRHDDGCSHRCVDSRAP